MKGKLIGALLGVALLGLIGYRIYGARQAASAPATNAARQVSVRVVPVEKGTLTERISMSGTIRPLSEVDVFAKAGGRIERMNVRAGDRVKAGDLLATIEAREVSWQAAAADAAVEVARANLEGAKLDYDRTRTLFEGGSAPKAQLDGAAVRLSQARAGLAQAEASAGLARQQVRNARVEAPISGLVTRSPFNVGNQVGPQVPLFTIQDVSKLKMETSVDAQGFTRLTRGQKVEITTDAHGARRFPATVAQLTPTLDSATRRAPVELEIENPDGALLSNMFAQAEISVGELKDVLLIPREAVLSSPSGAAVFVVKDGKANEVRPKLGPTDGAKVVVLSGLSLGDPLAVTGLGGLTDGAPVVVADPATQGARAQLPRESPERAQ